MSMRLGGQSDRRSTHMSTTATSSPEPATAPDSAYALLFPGQGSQRPGMAAPWAHDPAFVRWADADEVLGADITRLGLEADAAELRNPEACQIALFVHHAVLADAWRRDHPAPLLLAGHSLGEY